MAGAQDLNSESRSDLAGSVRVCPDCLVPPRAYGHHCRLCGLGQIARLLWSAISEMGGSAPDTLAPSRLRAPASPLHDHLEGREGRGGTACPQPLPCEEGMCSMEPRVDEVRPQAISGRAGTVAWCSVWPGARTPFFTSPRSYTTRRRPHPPCPLPHPGRPAVRLPTGRPALCAPGHGDPLGGRPLLRLAATVS